MTRKTESIYFGCAAILFILLGIINLFCECYPFTDGSPNEGYQLLLFFVMFLFLPLLLAGYTAVIWVPAALVTSIFIKGIWRFRLLMLCPIGIIAFGFSLAGKKVPWRTREAACKRICQRAEPIIQAIENYRTKEQRPPESLDALVPDYLDKIPGTGIRAYPSFKYSIPKAHNRWYKDIYEKHKVSYELKVDLYRMFAWDCFFYWPSEDYPDLIYGGGTEIINKWAYVHE
jgi:hypothetical protein